MEYPQILNFRCSHKNRLNCFLFLLTGCFVFIFAIFLQSHKFKYSKMKKFFLLLAAAVGLNSVSAQTPGDDKGFGVRLGFEFPADGYSFPEEAESMFDVLGMKTPSTNVAFGLAIDNRWYVWSDDMFGVAINARWFDFSYGKGDRKKQLGSIKAEHAVSSVALDFCSPGLMFTYYPMEKMAVDAYYNFVPSMLFSSHDVDYVGLSGENKYRAAGISHVFGAAFRYGILNAGLEYKVGSLGIFSSDIDSSFDYDWENEDYELKANKFRIFVGMKF